MDTGGCQAKPTDRALKTFQKIWKEISVICRKYHQHHKCLSSHFYSECTADHVISPPLSRDQLSAVRTTKLPLFRARKMPPPWLIKGSSAILAQKFQHQQQLQFSIASALCAKRWKEKSVPAYTSRFGLPLQTIRFSKL